MNELALFVLEMGEVAHCFFLGQGHGFGSARLVSPFDDFGDTLRRNEMKITMMRRSASPCQLCGSNIPKTSLSAHAARRCKRLHLQVAFDITEERDVAYTRDYEQEKGASEDEDSEEGGDCECGGDQTVPYEVLLQVVPR